MGMHRRMSLHSLCDLYASLDGFPDTLSQDHVVDKRFVHDVHHPGMHRYWEFLFEECMVSTFLSAQSDASCCLPTG